MSGLVTGHPAVSSILRRWGEIALPDAWLTGSIVAQARWNEHFGFDPHHGIADADIVYFDAGDLSAEAEERTELRIASLFADLPVRFDVKNQARVHLWYAAKFGHAIVPYRSVPDAIGTYPTTAAAIGLRRATDLEIVAPFGLADLLRPVVRANATQITEAYYELKSARWRQYWPDLEILPWGEAVLRR
ncbi:nucleotidyltransferase family protein [Sphingopyxis sp. JAI128]|uniref:nucleotidyltransferase family protein n=1 Tax=Sphingopyxis sp. JAI128 TaxID=2723066 RepID=UPI0017D17473|nr:nucleotidyltransferase family protein [Sphingopyxis sp. JAI128]MBB6427702.1 hypothetical protein [Sphingopyxis sp. JAI128]